METREIRCEATVLVHVSPQAPSDWIRRVEDEEFPYRHASGSPLSVADGLYMLADNALRNGVEDASRLDGWGDLERGMVTLEVIDVEASVSA